MILSTGSTDRGHALNPVVGTGGGSVQDPNLLHAKGVQIDVENLSYSVQVGNEKVLKPILKNVSLRLRPGTMTALMVSFY